LKNAAPMQQHYDTSSVFVAVIGRPNVGKSSLTNRLVGEKVAIVTSKPQTTRTRITGVVTRGPLQYVLLDTPGVHKAHNKLGKRMDKTASDSIADVDVSMMLFEPYGALNEPEMVLVDALRSSGGPAMQSSIRPILSRSLLIWKHARPSSKNWVYLMPFTP
jgi:GTP-binding protein Era